MHIEGNMDYGKSLEGNKSKDNLLPVSDRISHYTNATNVYPPVAEMQAERDNVDLLERSGYTGYFGNGRDRMVSGTLETSERDINASRISKEGRGDAMMESTITLGQIYGPSSGHNNLNLTGTYDGSLNQSGNRGNDANRTNSVYGQPTSGHSQPQSFQPPSQPQSENFQSQLQSQSSKEGRPGGVPQSQQMSVDAYMSAQASHAGSLSTHRGNL